MPTTYRAVPLGGLGSAKAEVPISASNILDALEQAKSALGMSVAFDLCDGDRVVTTYRPARRWRSMDRRATPV
ncbi:hypothetical protein [Lichenibacterium dinghuense]|uniref:hypothetical protein n=1 Tax=Lichenibacterium dinghuense TaxID=2895977 RepID=UPI001F217B84|nr:hypothetical protein [Lichenibacterium sp. 6Y81]